MTKRTVLLALLLLVFLSSLVSRPEVWIGGDFQADRDYSRSYGGNSYFMALGPGLTVTVFPSDVVKVGLFASADFLMPISYLSLHGDHRLDLQYGLSYVQLFGHQGFSVMVGMNHSLYHEAESNERFPEELTYRRWNTMGVAADIGYVLRGSEHSYFTVGIGGSFDWTNKTFKFAPHVGGGFVF